MKTTDLVFAITSVAGSTAACAAHGDEATVRVLSEYYTLVADAARGADGRVAKVIGDAVLMTFPLSRVREAISILHAVQNEATQLWKRFDERCAVRVKAGAGPVIAMPLGPAGEERDDVYGDALNRLFKMPAGDFVMSDEVIALLR